LNPGTRAGFELDRDHASGRLDQVVRAAREAETVPKKRTSEVLAARIVIDQKLGRQACGASTAEVEPAAKCEEGEK
jgi:hypothetical protein